MERSLGQCGAAMLLALGLLIGSAWLGPQRVYAQAGCTQYPHCFSVLLDSDTQRISGIWMQTQNASITPGDSIHTNNTIWMNVAGGTNDLIEMGQRSYRYRDITFYDYYAAVNGSPVWSLGTSSDGSTHKFYMMSSGTNTWTFYLDGQNEYSSNFGISYGYASTAETGGEIYLSSPMLLDSTIYTSTFSNYVQELDSNGGN